MMSPSGRVVEKAPTSGTGSENVDVGFAVDISASLALIVPGNELASFRYVTWDPGDGDLIGTLMNPL